MRKTLQRLALSLPLFFFVIFPVQTFESQLNNSKSVYTNQLLGSALAPLQADIITLPFNESFINSSVSSDWIIGGNTILTGNGSIDPVGDGWLRLTGKNYNQTGHIYYNKSIPTNRGLIIDFDFASWGGSGADGLVFFLFDGTTTTFNPGGYGGSLGYAQRCGIVGLSNGYLGIGFDEFGNYSYATECRIGGPGQKRDSVAIRGPGSGLTGYTYVAGSGIIPAGIDTPSVTTRPNQTGDRYRHATIIIEPFGSVNKVSVSVNFGYGTTPVVVVPPTIMSFTSPATLKFGFVASTGSVTNYHEIRKLEIKSQVLDLKAIKTVVDVNGGNAEPDDLLQYSIALTNNSNFDLDGIEFTDPIPTNTTYTANSISLPSGSVLVSETPSINVTNIDIPALSQVNISFKVKIHTPLDVGTIISNQGSIMYDSDGDGVNDATIQTDGDLTQSEEQPTIIAVQSGPNFSQTSKQVDLDDVDGNGAASPGDVLDYSIIIKNTGNANAENILFTDSMPTKTEYVSGSGTASSGDPPTFSPLTLQWVGNVNAGAQVTISFSVKIDSSGVQIRDVISNQGQIQYDSDGNESLDALQLTDGDLTQPGTQTTDIMLGGRPEGVAVKSATDINGGNLEPGDVIQYTVYMQNLSSYDSNGMQFIDSIPNNTIFVANSVSSPSGSTINSTSPILDIEGINVPAHSSSSLSFRVQVENTIPEGINQIENQGLIYYDTNNDGTNDSNQLTDGNTSVAGNQPTILQLTVGSNFSTSSKAVQLQIDADGNQAVSPGDTLRYTVQIHNSGNQNASAVTLLDNLPDEITFVNGSLSSTPAIPSAVYNSIEDQVEWGGDIAVGSTVTLHYSATVNPSLAIGTLISNQAVISDNDVFYYTDGDSTQPGSQPTTVVLGGLPQGVAIKSALDLNGGNLVPGDIIRYDIVLNNLSSYDSLNMEFTDSIPNNCDYVANSLSAPSAATVISETPLIRIQNIDVYAMSLVSFSFKVKVKDTVPAGVSSISNQGLVFYDSDGNGFNDSSQQTDGDTTVSGNQPTVLSLAAGAIFSTSSKGVQLLTDADNNGSISPGDILRYTLVLINSGNQDASGVTLQDALPDNITFVAGSLSSTPAVPSASYLGGTVGWAGDIAAGSSVIVRYSAEVNAGLLPGTEISNQGVITSGGLSIRTDGDASQPGSQPTTVVLGGLPQGVAIKSASDLNGGNLKPGDIIRYDVVLSNQSAYDSVDMEFSDTAPGNTKIIPSSVVSPSGSTVSASESTLFISEIDILAGTQDSISFNVQVNATIPAGVSEISNQGIVFYDSDGNGNNDASQLTDGDLVASGNQPTIMPIIAGANFESSSKNVSLAVDNDGNGLVSPGDTLEYTIELPNQGDQDSLGVSMVDNIPEYTTYVSESGSASAPTFAYDDSDKEVVWTGNIAAGDTITIRFHVLIDVGLSTGTVITNQGLIFLDGSVPPSLSTDGDLQAPGRQPTDVVIGGSVAGFAEKSAEDINGGSLVAGDIIRYTLKFSNTSTYPASGLEFVDTIPANTTYVANSLVPPSGPNVVVVSTTPTLRITGIDVPALSDLEFRFDVQVNSSIPAGVTQIENQGLVHYDSNGDGSNDATQKTDSDLNEAGNQSTVLLFSNLFDPPSAYKMLEDSGYPSILWRQVWINDGNTSSEVVEIFDDIPNGTSYVDGSLVCTARGVSGVYTCDYDLDEDQIQFTGIIGPDPGAENETQANNEVIIEFRTLIDAGVLTVQNQARGFWDQNGDGVVDMNDENVVSNNYVLSDDPGTSSMSDATVWQYDMDEHDKPDLPGTGFAPNVITNILPQPSDKKYQEMGEMLVEIPKIDLRLPIVGIPLVNNQWDLTWLSYQLGYLNGTAFPTWAGNSVLTGHLTLPNGKPGPLFRLNELSWGDKIIIHAWDQEYIYEVREKLVIKNTDDFSLLKHKEAPWISLITCKDFDEKNGVYRSHSYIGSVLIRISD